MFCRRFKRRHTETAPMSSLAGYSSGGVGYSSGGLMSGFNPDGRVSHWHPPHVCKPLLSCLCVSFLAHGRALLAKGDDQNVCVSKALFCDLSEESRKGR